MSLYPCHVYCADIGSIKKGNFGWASVSIYPNGKQYSWDKGEEIQKLADELAHSLNEGTTVALGFECPLWVPVRHSPEKLTLARGGDGNRPWSFGAGVASLAAGLTETAWILQEVRKKSSNANAFLDWHSYQKSENGLFIWEAFVSGKAKTSSHTGDAKVAVRAFVKAIPSLTDANAVHPSQQTRSLIGAALLWAGWSEDLSLLHQPCIVIKP